ncbi:hypothetical protein HN51_026367 [Arachis hypogaea]
MSQRGWQEDVDLAVTKLARRRSYWQRRIAIKQFSGQVETTMLVRRSRSGSDEAGGEEVGGDEVGREEAGSDNLGDIARECGLESKEDEGGD